MTPPSLEGVRVLVVEDEALVAMLLEQMLEDLGCTVAGVASHVAAAVELVHSTEMDVAILDVNLAGLLADPVAEALDERKAPIIFASGYGREGLSEPWRDRPVLPKPFRLEELRLALLNVLSPT